MKLKFLIIEKTITLYFVLSLLFFFQNCTTKKTELVWDQSFYKIGSQSSIRTSDLNKDGTLDLIIGAGKNEEQYSESGILAINGVNGALIWQQETQDQVFGAATFIDINNDEVEDIVIGGRGPNLKALNGKTGEVLWKYNPENYQNDSLLKYAKFNFYNSVIIPDQNNDGLSDILTVNGGNAKAKVNSLKDRYPGVLLILDVKNGNIIKGDTMPDGKESYMSPICFSQPNSTSFSIIFGSGGETISGNLYQIPLSEFRENGLKKAQIIASEKDHGFIAPPTAVDISQDGIYDVVAISHGSSIFAINGKDQSQLWEQKIENTECSNSFAVGYFNQDEVPDLFTFVSKGVWPENNGSFQIMLDGKNGNIAYLDSMGCTGFSSPVVYDLNDDGVDEAIVSINEFDCNTSFANKINGNIQNKLLAINFKENTIQPIDQQPNFKNIFTTPWIGDLDKDGYLDILYCQYYSPNLDILSFLGMRVKRIATSIKMRKEVRWGSYMGANGDGIFSN
ncbi:MAG: PQQ-binding-like beta-propeller repeat protein [Flammeovirgaceae bacterium]|nr:PQQ-binding-like beta-propeller repeat protein [Flammeovirgaceae bacterium]